MKHSLLKIMLSLSHCEFFWNKVNKMVRYICAHGKQFPSHSWHNYFVNNFILALPESKKAVQLMNKVGGKVSLLSQDSLQDLSMLVLQHKPNYNTLPAVSHGGHNILFGNFTNLGKSQWNPFASTVVALQKDLESTVCSMWDDPSAVPFIHPTYLVSKLVNDSPSVPQVAHTNFNPKVCKAARTKLFIALAPAAKEGCMLLVWTSDTYKFSSHIYNSHYYLHIPFGNIIYLPGDCVHAGGFCFGRTEEKAFTNERVHFYICDGSGIHQSNKDTISDALNGYNYNCYGPEFKPEPATLATIQGQLNDSDV